MAVRKTLLLIALLGLWVESAVCESSTWTNEHWGPNPSEYAKSCVDFKHENLVEYCEKQMHKKYDPTDMHKPSYPTWELCCAQFNEYNCYLLNAKHYCAKPEVADQIDAYTRKFGAFLEPSICGTVRFIGGQPTCNKANHDAVAAYYNQTVEEKGHKSDFVQLPVAEGGPTRSCLEKLRTNPKGDLKKKCLESALDRWDHARRKLFESAVLDACCALYESLDCIEHEASSHCSSVEYTDVAVYRAKAVIAYTNSVCKAVPYNLASMHCHR